MGGVRVPRHRVTVTSDKRVTCVTHVTTAVTWSWGRLKAMCRRMRRPLNVLLVCLLFAATASVFLETPDPPPPPPEPDQAATLLSVATLPRDDSVVAMERELERALGQPRRRQTPAASSFDRHVDEAARIVAVHIKEFRD